MVFPAPKIDKWPRNSKISVNRLINLAALRGSFLTLFGGRKNRFLDYFKGVGE